jgi:superfamily II DNA/RNA helicase
MTTTFASLGVPDAITRALAGRGIEEPFPIQAATIADALAGRDLCGKAPTGSGKTIAFGVPLVARISRSAPKRPKGLVLVPTRELATQVAEEIRSFSGDLRVLAVYGGAGIEPQIKKLRSGVDIVVACPGRLLDVIERKACDLRDVTFAVVDEADRMADMGFLPDVRRILDMAREDRQTVLFSATLDGAIDALVKRYQHDPVIHELAEEDSGDVVHHFWISERPERPALAAQVVALAGPTIVFCRTRHGSDRVAKQMLKAGVKAAAIHGGRTQAQRERALAAFHRGEVQALIATDVAARGIHVEGVLCVLHYDIPADHKDYVHRSGRTGRAGATGTVVALLDKGQRKDAVKLKRGAGVDADIVDPDVSVLPGRAGSRAAGAAAPADRPVSQPVATRTEQPHRTARPRPARAEREQRPARDPREVVVGSKRPAGEERSESRPSDGKNRPSGAARRKAKKHAMAEAGVAPPSGTKRRRSGKPRPPSDKTPAGARRSAGRS